MKRNSIELFVKGRVNKISDFIFGICTLLAFAGRTPVFCKLSYILHVMF